MSFENESENDLDQLIFSSHSAGQALKGAFKIVRKTKKNLSQKGICSRIGLRSAGNLTDFFAGRRTLKSDVVKAICRTLGLSTRQTKLVLALNDSDRARSPLDRQRAHHRLEKLRTSLNYRVDVMTGPDGVKALLKLKVLGLVYVLKPTLKELKDLVSVREQRVLEEVVKELLKKKLIDISNAKLHLIAGNVFLDGDDHKKKALFMTSINEVFLGVDQWFSQPSYSFFDAGYITCQKKNIPKLVERLRELYEEFIVESEDADANSLICLGLFFYPYFTLTKNPKFKLK